MTTLLITNYKNLLEQQLHLVLRLAFLQRPVVADLAALAGLDVSATADGDLVYVASEDRVYLYSRYSSAASNPPAVVLPLAAPAAYPGAAWLEAASAATFGPNWRAPLQSIQSGTLRAVEVYAGQGDIDEKWQRVMAAAPSMILEFADDHVEPLSAGYPGSFYRVELPMSLTVFSENLRGDPWSSWGSPASLSETSDPGAAVIIGAARKVLAGMSGDELGLVGLDRIELGDARLVDELFMDRYLVWQADFKATMFIRIPDEDLDALLLDAEPQLADTGAGQARFDPQNLVAQGLSLPLPASGLVAQLQAGVALVGGAVVAAATASRTWAASRDTFVDLAADGSLSYQAVVPRADPPALATGALRLGYARADDLNLLEWTQLCSVAQTFRQAYQIAP